MSDEKTAAPGLIALKQLPDSGAALTEDFQRYQFYHLGRFHGCPAV